MKLFDRVIRAALAAAVLIASASATSAAAETSGIAPAQRALRDVRAFRQTGSTVSLQHAIHEIEAATPPRRPGAERDAVTTTWFTVLNAIDGAHDPAFDPKDVPQLHVIPPPDRGTVYPAGVDPQAISDPAARATYESALRENDAKSARYARQYMLRDLDARATAAFVRYRRLTFAPTTPDRTDFRRLLVKSGLSATRKTAISAER